MVKRIDYEVEENIFKKIEKELQSVVVNDKKMEIRFFSFNKWVFNICVIFSSAFLWLLIEVLLIIFLLEEIGDSFFIFIKILRNYK